MGLFSKKDDKRYCLLCGRELEGEKCAACGREAKPLVLLSALNWQKVPPTVAEALGEQKKKLFGNPLLTVKEMILAGELSIADIYIDKVYQHEHDASTEDDEYRTEYTYYIQFSTPDLAPCDTDCESSEGDYDRAEELLKNGQHAAKILWGRKKKTNYYYAFVPRTDDETAMLSKGLFEKFIAYGENTEKRDLPPKGGEGNTTYDKVFDAIWNNTFGRI